MIALYCIDLYGAQRRRTVLIYIGWLAVRFAISLLLLSIDVFSLNAFHYSATLSGLCLQSRMMLVRADCT